ncbi:hypothetical protein MHBO_003353 [Bonamia ostreae]|uniref:Uncharacterized protein n=1 Tax=Bonamia ostreae TaxID=126728 RepID=A0ABV2AQJ7_9EUKA
MYGIADSKMPVTYSKETCKISDPNKTFELSKEQILSHCFYEDPKDGSTFFSNFENNLFLDKAYVLCPEGLLSNGKNYFEIECVEGTALANGRCGVSSELSGHDSTNFLEYYEKTVFQTSVLPLSVCSLLLSFAVFLIGYFKCCLPKNVQLIVY